jgi:hypothetical protein
MLGNAILLTKIALGIYGFATVSGLLLAPWNPLIFIPAAMTAAIYFAVFKNLPGNIATAKSGAMVLAVVGGVLFLLAVQQGIFLNMILNGAAALCLGLASSELKPS